MKTKQTFTPGPWNISSGGLVVTNNGIMIANCYGMPLGVENAFETEANARLIASAPELLEALKREHGSYIHLTKEGVGITGWENDFNIEGCTLCQLIKKAEGK